MRSKVLLKSKDGKEWVMDKAPTDPQKLDSLVRFLESSGYTRVENRLPNAMEYSIEPVEKQEYTRVKCTGVGCNGGFVQRGSGYAVCACCGGDGTVLTPIANKKLDKLIEGLNL